MLSYNGCNKPSPITSIVIQVSTDHPLMKMVNHIPWMEMAGIIREDLKKTTVKGFIMQGRKLHLRVHLAAYLLQLIYQKTDREISQDLNYNGAFQIFAGASLIENWQAPHYTKIQTFRSRLSPETQRKIANIFAKIAVEKNFADAKHVDIDSTVQEAGITYPSDAKLMVQLSEKSTKVIS